jgi:hypothetical protein
MGRIINFLKFLFLPDEESETKKPYKYGQDEYKTLKKGRMELHRDYLKDILSKEDERLVSIESKTAQLISQTGLVFSLLSLFVPFIIDDILLLNVFIKVPFIILLAFAYLFYILAIHSSLKNYNVKKFEYGRNDPSTVIKHQSIEEKEFLKIEIKDALYCINKNIGLNNQKATHLIRGYHFFRYGIIFTSILVVTLCISLLFATPKKETITIDSPIEIRELKESLEFLKIKDSMERTKQRDTLAVMTRSAIKKRDSISTASKK